MTAQPGPLFNGQNDVIWGDDWTSPVGHAMAIFPINTQHQTAINKLYVVAWVSDADHAIFVTEFATDGRVLNTSQERSGDAAVRLAQEWAGFPLDVAESLAMAIENAKSITPPTADEVQAAMIVAAENAKLAEPDDGERRCEECGESFNLEDHGYAVNTGDVDENEEDEPTLCIRCEARADLKALRERDHAETLDLDLIHVVRVRVVINKDTGEYTVPDFESSCGGEELHSSWVFDREAETYWSGGEDLGVIQRAAVQIETELENVLRAYFETNEPIGTDAPTGQDADRESGNG